MNDKFSSFIRVVTSKKRLKGLLDTPLYTNACYLVADVVVVSILGFAFWALVARLYSPTQVGLASATVAAVVLLARLSRLGFGYGLIRFLPGIGERAGTMMNSCFTIAGLTSLVAALIFLSGLTLWSPALLYIRHPGLSIFFIFLTVAYTLFLLVEQAFIARRRAKFVLFKNAAAGIVKIVAAIALASLLNTSGIFASWALPNSPFMVSDNSAHRHWLTSFSMNKKGTIYRRIS